MIVYTWNLKRTEYFWRAVLPDIFMDISNHKNQHHDRNIRFWFRACQNLHFDKLKNISKNQLAVRASLATIGIQRCQILTKNAKYELNTSISLILINVKSKNSHKMLKKNFFKVFPDLEPEKPKFWHFLKNFGCFWLFFGSKSGNS